jgi:hypothetical protein
VSELPRHQAPARLRAMVAGAGAPASRRGWWMAPALASAATALILILFFIPLLPRMAPPDPVLRLTRAVVAEHTRAVMWGARRPDIIPTASPWLTQESGIGLSKVFGGDDRLTLLEAEPVYLEQHRGVAVHYRDVDGHRVTYVTLPAPSGWVLPERQRVKIDRWRPALLNESGFSSRTTSSAFAARPSRFRPTEVGSLGGGEAPSEAFFRLASSSAAARCGRRGRREPYAPRRQPGT